MQGSMMKMLIPTDCRDFNLQRTSMEMSISTDILEIKDTSHINGVASCN